MLYVLILTLALTVSFLFTHVSRKWKVVVSAIVGTSVVMQFSGVHFVIPLLIQITVSIVLLFYYRLNGYNLPGT